MRPPPEPSAQAPASEPFDFDIRPFTVAWEVTRACALACLHCRAEAQPRRNPRELTMVEAFQLIEQLVDLAPQVLVVTGGDPLMRPDVFEIMSRATGGGLRVAFSPSATARCNRDSLARARDCGISRIHISLDGPDAESHDSFRGVRGSFDRTRAILSDISALGIPLQVGTTVTRHSVSRLPAISQIVREYGAVMWSLFFLVPTGRGRLADMVSPEEHEQVFNWLYDHAREAPYDVRTTAGMAYRRVAAERRRLEGRRPDAPVEPGRRPGPDSLARAGLISRGVNDGDGFAFIDHVGNVCPSGFLQLPAGNVRERPLAEIYRHSGLFRALRDRSRLKGKCGVCEYRDLCGGSRARAWAVTGDYLASDPSCPYAPSGRVAAC